ncbi:MAG: 6-pyruvoyl-tetrahydropterin synthase-related protein [Candidatus Acidiferrales bacterium]
MPVRALLAITAVATLIVLPMLFRGNVSGHDMEFHLASWMDVAQQWHQGVLYPRWTADANYGFGEPRFIFYPPISWLAGSALGCVLPWRVVPGALIWLALVLAGLSMWRLARSALPEPDAILAAVFFAANPYILMVVYFRSDYAELIAIALFPLLVLGLLRVAANDRRAIGGLAVVYAAIWLSNAPEAVLASYSAALLLVVLAALKKSLVPVLAGGAALAAGMGLAAYYILPAAYEQRWVDIGQVLSFELKPIENFLFTHADNPEFVWFNWRMSMIACLMLGTTAIAGGFAGRRRIAADVWWTLATLTAMIFCLMSRVSLPVWEHFPKLRFVQFPWRWLGPLAVPCSMFLAMSFGGLRKKWLAWIGVWAVLAILLGVMISTAWWDTQDVPELKQAIASGKGYEGTDEYTPLGGDRTDLPEDAPRASALNEDGDPMDAADGVRLHVQGWGPEQKHIEVESRVPLRLAPKLEYFPAWHVDVNGHPATAVPAEDTAQLLVPLPPGTYQVDIRMAHTWDRTTGALISQFTAAGMLGWAWASASARRRRTRGLPTP